MFSCPVCGAAPHSEFYVKDRQTLLISVNCRHIWWHSLPDEIELQNYYRSSYTGNHSQGAIQSQAREYYRGHLLELADAVRRKPRDIALLDYGCSIPVLGHEAVNLSFARVLGVDWAGEAREQGRAWGVEVVAPPELASIPDRSIDIARFSHIIEHSIDPLSLLRAVLPKMRPGGLVYITQPNFPVFRAQPSAYDLLDTVYPEHLHFFSALSLLEMVSRLSLCVTRFFSHQNEAAVVEKYGPILDLDYARDRLACYASKGDPYFPKYANFPYYAGENSVLYARVTS
jgi:SAM-dependent methyltransferase